MSFLVRTVSSQVGKKWRMIQREVGGAELLNVGPGAGSYLRMRSALCFGEFQWPGHSPLGLI